MKVPEYEESVKFSDQWKGWIVTWDFTDGNRLRMLVGEFSVEQGPYLEPSPKSMVAGIWVPDVETDVAKRERYERAAKAALLQRMASAARDYYALKLSSGRVP